MEAELKGSCLNKPEHENVFKSKRKLCEYCNKWFADKYLHSHIRLHTGNKPYSCNICNKEFNQSQNLRTHVRIHHTVRKPFRCHICGRHFMDKFHFNEHVVAHSGILPYFCSICGKKYAYKHSLKWHLRCRHKTTLTATRYCDPENKPNKVTYEEEQENNFFCEICNEGFVYENLLIYHMRIHNPEIKAFKCILCRRVFSRRYRFHSHLWSKHNIKIAFQCKICKERFPDEKALRIHYDFHCVENCLAANNPLPQEINNELTDLQEKEENRNELDSCVKNNNKVKGRSCSKTANAPQKKIEAEHYFENDTSQYKLAETNITQEEAEIGTEPEQEFANSIKQNKYPCDVSNVSQKHTMKTDSEQFCDSGKDRYLCGICYEEFNSVTSIQEHLRTHTPTRSFVCNKCQCSDSESLSKQHACFNSFEIEPLQCMICKERFSIWNNFKEHLSRHANDDTP